MTMNTNLSRECVFIAGMPKGVLNDDFSEFQKMHDLLYERNIPSISEVSIQWNDFTNDKTELLDRAFKLKVMVSHMALCRKVITLSDWDKSPELITLVGVARLMNKEVVLADTVMRNLSYNAINGINAGSGA